MNAAAPGVKSALRTLQVLELFAELRRPLTLGDLARHMAIPKSSCLALLATLADRGYLHRLGVEGSYYPTRRWLDQAQQVAGHDSLGAELQASLRRLQAASGETAIAAVLRHDRSVYLDVVESEELVRFTARAGDSKPLHVSASGRAQLGLLGDDELTALVAGLKMERITARSRTSPRALRQAVLQERERGWSVNLGEYRSDVISIAAGVLLHGTPHSLVIAAPYQRIESRVDRLGALVRQEAQALHRRVHGQADARHARAADADEPRQRRHA